MKSSSILLLAGAFLAIVSPTTNAIKCYVCQSMSSSNCNGTLVNCSPSDKECYKFSGVYTVTKHYFPDISIHPTEPDDVPQKYKNSNNFVEKSCTDRNGYRCSHTNYEKRELRTSECYCSTDGCNAATASTTPSRVLYVMIPLVVISKWICSAIVLKS